MGCGSRSFYNYGGNCSKEFVKQVAGQLATIAIRDTEFADVDDTTGDEYIAIVQDEADIDIKEIN